ncbi:MAG: sigma-70 family RNA polymerase sigma factor [Ruminococcaceae bacterium]|nr:sigma-70 family RNA polymerase sigma factor [Oscillospiraceae bacterium]
MNDREIVQLYFDRNPVAIEKTAQKYKSYCICIAKNILGNSEDSEECFNDTLHNTWNSIPPKKPENLGTYLGKIIRNLCFDRYRRSQTEKRGKGETALVLSELKECVSGKETPEQNLYRKELSLAINSFLNTLSKEKRSIFVCRYWYAFSVSDIAKKFGKTETNISVILSRLRGELKEFLTERGYEI